MHIFMQDVQVVANIQSRMLTGAVVDRGWMFVEAPRSPDQELLQLGSFYDAL